jgi:hypothetical protein
MYNLASVLIALRHYHLQLENLDQIITMVKMGQMIHTWIAWQMQTSRIYIKSEIVLIIKNYELIEEFKYFLKLQVDND